MTIDEIFGTTGDTNALQECARALLIFAYGLLLVRIGGRRLFSRWGAVDIIVAIVIGSNFSRALTGSADLFGTLLANTLLIALHWVLARAAAGSLAWSRALEGAAVPLAREGELDRRAMLRHGMSHADLAEALRTAGLEHEDGARVIVLEPSGRISVLKRDA
jgi:uncharacterized membrane protein YcaP (DUF421 family)